MIPRIVSIFSGGGGIDSGFHAAGFQICLSTDFWDIACNTLIKNRISKKVVCDDIRNIDYVQELNEIDFSVSDIDVLVGGPPCPAYSKSRFYRTDKKRALEDENAFTLYEYFRALETISPKVFFFENVPGFLFKPHREAFELLESESEKLGYEISYKVVNAANFGVPQMRERFICVGVKKTYGKKFEFPDETHFDFRKIKVPPVGKAPWVNCLNAIGDLDYDLPEDMNMQAGSKHKDLLKEVPPGDNYLYFTKERGYPEPIFKWRSRYWSFLLKLSPDLPSWTIQASFSNNMGPFHWKNRFLRISEIKRLQTFDDDYYLEGNFRDQWRQVGNAVPPLLAKVIAIAIKNQYFGDDIDD